MIRRLVPLLALIASTRSQEVPSVREAGLAPSLVQPSFAREEAILKDVTVADGFEAGLFALLPAGDLPVFVAATRPGIFSFPARGKIPKAAWCVCATPTATAARTNLWSLPMGSIRLAGSFGIMTGSILPRARFCEKRDRSFVALR